MVCKRHIQNGLGYTKDFTPVLAAELTFLKLVNHVIGFSKTCVFTLDKKQILNTGLGLSGQSWQNSRLHGGLIHGILLSHSSMHRNFKIKGTVPYNHSPGLQIATLSLWPFMISLHMSLVSSSSFKIIYFISP